MHSSCCGNMCVANNYATFNYIVDFYAPAVKLVVEIDGGQHFSNEYLRRDQKRDAYLASMNLKVLRFDNGQVLKSLGDVLDEIYRQIKITASKIKIPPVS